MHFSNCRLRTASIQSVHKSYSLVQNILFSSLLFVVLNWRHCSFVYIVASELIMVWRCTEWFVVFIEPQLCHSKQQCYCLALRTLCMCRRIYTTVTARGASRGWGWRWGRPKRGRTPLQCTTTPPLRGGLLRVPLAGPAPEPVHGEQSRAVQRPPTPRVRTQVPPQPVPQDVPSPATR